MVTVTVLFFSFLWALTALTYLLPPKTVYANLFSGELSRNQGIFLAVGTLLLAIEFTFARHLFCRFACAVGVFQSLAWMGNKKAMVVGFNVSRARDCQDCNNACDNACPMRLKPRTVKRNMFTCTNCAECIRACTTHNDLDNKTSLLKWVQDECALQVSDSGFGKYPKMPARCFQQDDEQYNQTQNDKSAQRVSV
jgi:polyferredoxin